MGKYGSAVVGQLMTADFYNGSLVDVYVKATNETRTSTTTYSPDAEITGIPLAIGTWLVEMRIPMIGGAGGIALKTTWVFTGSWNNPARHCIGPTAGNTTNGNGALSTQRTQIAAGTDAVYGLGTSTSSYTVVEENSAQVTVTVAGTLSLTWAPNVSSATSGGVRTGAYAKVRQIA